MSNKDNFKTWLDTKSVQTPTPAVPNTLYKTAYSKNITVEEWNSLLQYINRAVAKTNSWLTGFQESYDATPDLSVVCNLKDNTIPVWDTSAQKFVNSTIEVADGLVKVANSVDKSRMDIDKNSFTVYTGSKDTGVKFKLPELRSGVAEVSLLTDALPIRAGSGANAVVVNDISGETSNVAYSENTTAFGTGNSIGLKGYFYSDNAIDFENKTITLSTAHENGEAVNCAYEAGYVISIVNDIKYESCSTITAVNGNVITVDNLPFTEIVTGGSDFEDYSIYCPEHPEIGVADLGKNSAVFGKDNAVHNAFNFVSGNNNSAVGTYATVFGNRNKSGYGNLVQGVDNTWLGQKGAAFGEGHTSSANRAYTVGLNNKHNARLTFSAGTDNVLNSERQFVQGVGNTVEGKYGFVSGDGNNISSAYTHVLGNLNTVNVTDSISETTYSDVVVGSSNTVTRKWAGAFGNRNTVKSFGGYAFGIGLSSPPKIGGSSYTPYQILLGAYNASSGLSEYEAQVVVGGGTPSAPKTLATLSTDGNLHLAGHALVLRSPTEGDKSITAESIQRLNRLCDVITVGSAGLQFNAVSKFPKEVIMSDDLTVAGNFTVTGTTTVQDVKNLAVEDLTITLSKNAPLGVSLAGIIVPDYNGMSQPGGLVFDDTGTAYVGDISVSSEGTVTQGDARPIAVRSDAVEWSENSIPRWSSTFDGFEPSGFTTDSFVQKNTSTDGYYLYARKNGTEAIVQYSTAAGNGRIPMYDVGGVLRAGTAVGDNDAVNLKQMNDALAKKLDKYTPTDVNYSYVYGTKGSDQTQYILSNQEIGDTVALRTASGALRVNTPTKDVHAVNLKYFNEHAVALDSDELNLLRSEDQPAVFGFVNPEYVNKCGKIYLARNFTDIEMYNGHFLIPLIDINGNLSVQGVGDSIVDPDENSNLVPTVGDLRTFVNWKVNSQAIKAPEESSGDVGQILACSGHNSVYSPNSGTEVEAPVMSWVDMPASIRHWVATLSKTSDPESQGQVEFWSTGTPNSTTNPTNFSDLFAKRVGKAVIRSIQGTGTEYFVYGLGWLGSTGVMYHTTYPFTDGDISGVNYDSVTLSELT